MISLFTRLRITFVQKEAGSRYWRILSTGETYFGNSSYEPFFQASEILMFESPDATGTNVCIGATAIVSSTGIGNASAVNNNVTGDVDGLYWSSGLPDTPAPWWGIDLGSGNAAYIRSLVVWPRVGYVNGVPRTAKLQKSDDGASWVDVGAEFTLGINTTTWQSFTVTNIT